jgi:hypothetical protein
MPSAAWLRDLDSRVWATATWATPFSVQLVLGAMFIALWLLGKVPPFTTYNVVTHSTYVGERAWLLTGAVITALVSIPVSGLLLRSHSSRTRGVALSIVSSTAIVFIGAIIFAFWLLRW